jgi:hypothetical protein
MEMCLAFPQKIKSFFPFGIMNVPLESEKISLVVVSIYHRESRSFDQDPKLKTKTKQKSDHMYV